MGKSYTIGAKVTRIVDFLVRIIFSLQSEPKHLQRRSGTTCPLFVEVA